MRGSDGVFPWFASLFWSLILILFFIAVLKGCEIRRSFVFFENHRIFLEYPPVYSILLYIYIGVSILCNTYSFIFNKKNIVLLIFLHMVSEPWLVLE